MENFGVRGGRTHSARCRRRARDRRPVHDMRGQRGRVRGAIGGRLRGDDAERAIGGDGVVRRRVRGFIDARAQRADERFRFGDAGGERREGAVGDEGGWRGGRDEGGYEAVDVALDAGALEGDGQGRLERGGEVGGCDLRDCGVELARGGSGEG